MLRVLIAFVLFITTSLSVATAQIKRPVSGVVAFTSGDIRISYQDESGEVIGRSAGIGDPIYLNDEIATGPDTNLQILLKDQTVFTIGPDSSIIFDEFVYDPADAETSSLSATITKGTFKFISGKIASQKPDNVALNLPNATASIRGTTVAGRVKNNGDSDVILLSGAIAVSSDVSPEPVDIFTSGWGTSISDIGAIEAPFPVPEDILNDILETVTIDITALRAAVDPNAPEGEGEGEGDETVAAGPVLTPETVETIEDIVTLVTTNIASDDEGNVNIGDLASYVLSSGLAEQLGIPEGELEEAGFESINFDSRLLGFLIGGETPLYLQIKEDSGSYSIVNDPSLLQGDEFAEQLALYNNKYAGLVSETYAGSATFTRSGLSLGRGSTTVTVPTSYNSNGFATFSSNLQGSGSVDYTVTLNYETTAVTGTVDFNDLAINGQTYADIDGTINTNFNGESQASKVLYTNSGHSGSGGGSADISFMGGFASISDGSNVIDGLIGSFDTSIYETTANEYINLSSDPASLNTYVTNTEVINFDMSEWSYDGGTYELISDSNVAWDLDGVIYSTLDGDVAQVTTATLNNTSLYDQFDDGNGGTTYILKSDNDIQYFAMTPEKIPALSATQHQIGTAN